MRYIGLIWAPSNSEEGASKPPPTDWAEIFADLICNTSITRKEIPYMTIPEIQSYRKQICLINHKKFSNIFGIPTNIEQPEQNKSKPPTLQQFADFANLFNR